MISARFNRRGLVALLLALWQLVTGGSRVFFWDSLKNGMIDVKPLPRALRVLTIVGLLAVFCLLASLLLGDTIRAYAPMEPLAMESSAARGLLVPIVLIPLTLIAMTVAWSYTLTGALHVRAGVRWGIVALYILFWVSGLIVSSLGASPQALLRAGPCLAVVGGALALLLAAVIVLPRRSLPLAAEFAIMALLNTVLVGLALLQTVTAQRNSGFPYVTSYLLTTTLDLAQVLIIPFIFLMGNEMVNFGLDVSRWAAKSVQRYATRALVAILLVVFLGYRLYRLVAKLAAGVPPQQWSAWAGALILCVGIGLVFLWRRRLPGGEGISLNLVTILVVALTAWQLLIGPLLMFIGSAFQLQVLLSPSAQSNLDGVLAQANRAMQFAGSLSDKYDLYMYLITAAVGLILAVIAARRAKFTVAAFGLILAWKGVLEWLTEPGRPLQAFRYNYGDVDTILLLVLSALATLWIVRSLTQRPARSQAEASPITDQPQADVPAAAPEQAGAPAPATSRVDRPALQLVALVILGAILTQTSFLDNPFSPLFGFAGIFFLAFGILWNTLTIGGRFANAGTPAFPRASRLLLYLGYTLLSVSVSHWFTVSHNVQVQALLSDMSMSGFRIFGLAMAYLAFAEGGRTLIEYSHEAFES